MVISRSHLFRLADLDRCISAKGKYFLQKVCVILQVCLMCSQPFNQIGLWKPDKAMNQEVHAFVKAKNEKNYYPADFSYLHQYIRMPNHPKNKKIN